MTVHLVTVKQAEGASRGVKRVTKYCRHAKTPAFIGSGVDLDLEGDLTTKRKLVTCKVCRKAINA